MKSTNAVLSDSFTDLLISMGIKKSVKEGDIILQEHAYLNSIPIVLSGNIKVLRTDEDGREILLYYIKQGESCIMSFLGGIHQDTSKVKAIAEEDSEILFLPIQAVGMLLKEYPEWLEYIFALYHKRFEELLDVVNAVTFKKMDQRLSDFLYKKVEITKSNVLSITHEQIATELGTARVVVSRLLKQLEEMASVKLGRNNITVM